VTTINQNSLDAIGKLLHGITAICFNEDADPPWLSQANNWFFQHRGAGFMTQAGTTPATGNAGNTANDAILAEIGKFRNGITAANLGLGLKASGTTIRNLGPALANLQRSGLIHKQGDLWMPGPSADKKVSMGLGRKQAQRRGRTQATAGNAEQEQQRAAAE